MAQHHFFPDELHAISATLRIAASAYDDSAALVPAAAAIFRMQAAKARAIAFRINNEFDDAVEVPILRQRGARSGRVDQDDERDVHDRDVQESMYDTDASPYDRTSDK
jgi:hypothetical protein